MKFFMLFVLSITLASRASFADNLSQDKACLGEIQFLKTHGNPKRMLSKRLQDQQHLQNFTYGTSVGTAVAGGIWTFGAGIKYLVDMEQWYGDDEPTLKGTGKALFSTLAVSGGIAYLGYHQNKAIQCTQYQIDSIVNAARDSRVSTEKHLRGSTRHLASQEKEKPGTSAIPAAGKSDSSLP